MIKSSVQKAAEKFIHSENEKKAERYFKQMTERSVGSIMGGVHDTIHIIAGIFK